MALDLLTVGESFAELDLVVRQLDDGSLTLATDDSLPDEARMRVSGSPAGLLASLKVGQVLLTPALCRGLNALNARASFGRWVWRGGLVRVEAHLPFGDRSYAHSQLRLVYGAVAEAAKVHGERVLAVARGDERWEALQGEALPPSYLPGAGQKSPDDRTTQRFGDATQVPGKPELGRGDKRPSQRAPAGRPSSQRVPSQVVTARPGGGGGVIVALLLLLALGVVGYAGWVMWQKQQEQQSPTPGPATPGDGKTGTGSGGPQDPTTPGPTDPPEQDPPVGPDPDPGPTPGTPDRPRPGPLPQSEEELLARLKAEPGDAARLVARWVDARWDRKEGARRRLLEALPREELPPEVVKSLVRSVRDHAPDPFEAIDCWPLAPSSVKRVLLQHMAAAGEGQDEVAAFLNTHLAEDTEDKLMQEALLLLGRPREETIKTLVDARGAPWALLGDGRALIEGAVKADLGRITPLVQHADEELRAFACGLLGQSEQARKALELLAPLLADSSEKVQQRAIEAAVQLGQPDASWPLARALQRAPAGPTRDALRDAFRRLPAKQTVPLLSKLYEKDQPAERLAAVLALEATEATEGVPGLVKALSDKAREVKLAALGALTSHQKSKPALRPAVMEGLAAIRAVALDKSDRELSRLASQLHLAIAGRMPDQGNR